QKQFPPTNNQLRTSSNSKTHATVHDGQIGTEPIQRKAPGNVRGEGHVARQCKEPKRKMDSQYFKDKALLMEAKEKGDVLDAEAEAFLTDVDCTAPYDQPQALTTTNMFQANHEDAYDSDVDEGPNAAVAFMANLSSTSTTNLYSISLNDMMSASPVCLLTKASSTKSWLWHRRLNHLNFGTLNELARKNLVRGLPMLKYDKDHLCPSCQLGKSKKASHPPILKFSILYIWTSADQ
ncbi:retrovirus-related pol polyprotein from transposon TNT 1-94, partial [Tanacetum coccineum]